MTIGLPGIGRAARVESAIACAARALSVIPIEPQGQRPLVAWRAFQRHIAGRDEIGRWLRPWPDANLGS